MTFGARFVCSRGLFVLFASARLRTVSRRPRLPSCCCRRLPCAAFSVTALAVRFAEGRAAPASCRTCRGARYAFARRMLSVCFPPHLFRAEVAARPPVRSFGERTANVRVRRFCRRYFPLRRAVWLPLLLSSSCGSPCSRRSRYPPDPTFYRPPQVCRAERPRLSLLR